MKYALSTGRGEIMTASKDSAYATGKNVCLYLFLGPLEQESYGNGSIVGETKLKPLSNQL